VKNYPQDEPDRLWTFNEYLGVSLAEVKANFERFDLLDERTRFVEGWFRDTIPQAKVDSISVLRLDGDLYESTGWSWAISIPEFCRVVSLSLTIMLCPPAKRRWTIFAQNIRFTRQLRPLIGLEFSGASEPASPDAGYNCIPFSRDRRSQSVYQFNRGSV